jgi:hypothetical protein
VVTDRTDQQWYKQYGYLPTPTTNKSRYGAGLNLSVRGLQWSNFLAQDNIFFLFDVTNISETNYDKVVFGVVNGTAVGGQGFTAYNVSAFDQSRSITYTTQDNQSHHAGNWNTTWNPNAPIGYEGLAFLESPGNPFDGIDNDDDWNQCDLPNGGNPPQFQIGTGPYDFDPSTASLDPNTNQQILQCRRVLKQGDVLILISKDKVTTQFGNTIIKYNRSGVVLGADTMVVTSLGKQYKVYPGAVLTEVPNNNYDDNLNGLIDENYNLHYYRVKQSYNLLTKQPNPPVILPPLHYKDYITLYQKGLPLNDQRTYPMIDERRDDGLDKNGNPYITADPLATDAQDVTQSDQIGLTSYYFGSASSIVLSNVDNMWNQSIPGRIDQTADSFTPQDGDYVYAAGYFPLTIGQTERMSVALVYGTDETDVLSNKDIVQQIYNANYSFAKPPTPPTVHASVENHQVTLYWDNVAESYKDDFIRRAYGLPDSTNDPRVKTFEGYRIYRSSDPGFLDAFTVTGNLGQAAQQKAPLKQFDLIDGIQGGFPLITPQLIAASKGISYYLGSETGLQHSFVDTGLVNGKTYFYAVAAYTKGDTTLGIYPSEDPTSATPDGHGNYILGSNVVVAVPTDKVAGYTGQPTAGTLVHTDSLGVGTVSYTVLDRTQIQNKTYLIKFTDTSVDSIHYYPGQPITSANIQYTVPITSYYSVTDVTNPNAPVVVFNRNPDDLSNPNNLQTYVKTTQTYTADAQQFDGLYLSLKYNTVVGIDTARTGWQGSANKSNQLPYFTLLFDPTSVSLGGATFSGQAVGRANDYAITIQPGTSSAANVRNTAGQTFSIPPKPTNFTITNLTTGQPVRFIVNDARSPVNIDTSSAGTDIILLDQVGSTTPTIDTVFSWRFKFIGNATNYIPQSGDVFKYVTTKPLRKGDVFTLKTTASSISNSLANSQLSRIRVVPNPYIASSVYEQALPVGVTRGRGSRVINFFHIPKQATIRIYTIRGELIRTLTHNANSDDGNVTWDLTTSENLDVAYGVYLYHVDAPGIGTTTGKFAVIK